MPPTGSTSAPSIPTEPEKAIELKEQASAPIDRAASAGAGMSDTLVYALWTLACVGALGLGLLVALIAGRLPAFGTNGRHAATGTVAATSQSDEIKVLVNELNDRTAGIRDRLNLLQVKGLENRAPDVGSIFKKDEDK